MFPRILVLVAVVFLHLGLARNASADAQPPIAGTFRHAGGDAERRALDGAIEKSTESIVFFAKGAARSKLREATMPSPWMSIAIANGMITVTTPGAAPATSPESGAQVTVKGKDGTPVKLAQKTPNGQVLVQVIVLDGGWMQNVYTVSPDGTSLSVRVTLASSKLSAPLVYTLTYRR